MTAAGFTISGEDHAISPVMLGDAKECFLSKKKFQPYLTLYNEN
jgi:hypothetical protein